ncbi:NUDIX hydrolase [Paenactinomyces guangxiensis]|uniref:NUDIX domain-containing protein n=1 Tax=Paenactinomyces guangxiensis TaxID=1490290 RepID=A0A7W2A6K7_9BACL|nr:NUDIX domain-containing protein [Paenactinomyces guangxiensis]MBA4493471.1 NUDIX domain-containing protein [Paenactinomyces guangxiensis]MBH8590562.1 NUDIX domain-containing protein [Paenactinomyces guangxiensis]
MIYVNVRALIERTSDGKREILLQIRDREGEFEALELPGGQIEEFESLLQGLRREVFEETGLQIKTIVGSETYITTSQSDSNVECISPFAVYQTIYGPVDSMGVYFRCTAEGDLFKRGDGSKDARWVDIKEVQRLIGETPEVFSWVDLAGLKRYIAFLETEGKYIGVDE